MHLLSIVIGVVIGIAASAVYSLAHSAKLTALGNDIKGDISKAVTALKSKV